MVLFFFFSSRRRNTRFDCDWSSDVCSSDLGIEPSKHYVDICEKKGFKTYHSTIEDFKPKEKFDWALFFDILEHVKNPKEVLKKCNSLLKNDGKVFINIPVYESFYEKFERFF